MKKEIVLAVLASASSLFADSMAFTGFHLQEGGMDDTAFSAKLDEKEFSFRFEVHDSTMVVTDVLKEEFDTAYEDRVEVYLAPVADRSKPYFALEVDALGRVLDYRVDPKDRFDFKWNFKSAKGAPEPFPGGYAVTCRVDRKELEDLGIDFTEYYMAVFRADVQVPFGERTKGALPVKWYSAMPPPSAKAHFHQAGHFFRCRGNQMMGASIACPQRYSEANLRHYLQRHYWFNAHKTDLGEDAVVFLGDSITEGLGGTPAWKRVFGDEATRKFKGFNLGYDGDRTENVLWRLRNGQLDGYRAKAVILAIGTNNLANGYTLDEVLKALEEILGLIREKQPGAKVYLSAVLPREAKPDGKLRRLVDEWRPAYRTLAEKCGVSFLDLGQVLLDEKGVISKELMGDMLHPTAEGHERLVAELLRHL